jgi:hypothetical protein
MMADGELRHHEVLKLAIACHDRNDAIGPVLAKDWHGMIRVEPEQPTVNPMLEESKTVAHTCSKVSKYRSVSTIRGLRPKSSPNGTEGHRNPWSFPPKTTRALISEFILRRMLVKERNRHDHCSCDRYEYLRIFLITTCAHIRRATLTALPWRGRCW